LNPIEAHALTKQFGKLTAVNNLDLRIAQGEFFGFIGPNGAGKTTTLQMLSGQLPPLVFCNTHSIPSVLPVLAAIIRSRFAAAVVPVLVAQTLLSFYYQINDSIATLCIAGLGILLLAASKIILGRLDTRWKSTMFRIA
jgi:ABC-type uncharacterized transport system ATPase subunit